MRRSFLLSLAALAAAISIPATGGPIRDRIYPAPHEPISLADLPAGASIVRVTTADGLVLSGIERPGRSDRPVLLLFHGNASDAYDAFRWLRPLADRGYGIVSAEYRGYAANPGSPSEAGLAADADAFYARAHLLAGDRPVIVVGHSLGSGVGFALAQRRPIAALVTIGAFTSIRAMAPRIARAFISDRYDNLAAIATLAMPLYLIHGTDDDVVPSAMANALYHAAVAAKRKGGALVLRDAGHRPDAERIATAIDGIVGAIGQADRNLPTTAGATFYPFG